MMNTNSTVKYQWFSSICALNARYSSLRRSFDQGCRPAFAQRAIAGRPAPGVRCPPFAFTLIELLVVMLIIAILAGIAFPLAKYAARRANEARQKVMISQIRSALDEYRAVYGEYPITPPGDPADVSRHYPAHYPTYDYYKSNSLSTNVDFGSGIEGIGDVHAQTNYVDYCLTYPLMFRETDQGKRPFMIFPMVDVVYMVTRGTEGTDIIHWIAYRRTKGGKSKQTTMTGIYGDAVKRAEAIDPVSGHQWKYVCPDGLNYVLTTNKF